MNALQTTSVFPPIDNLLPRLDRVKKRASDRWTASCPTKAHKHGDRSQGLAIKELPNGTLLMKCPAGCDNRTILSCVGLSLRDLFPPEPPKVRAERKKQRRARMSRDAYELEVLICEIFLSDLFSGKPISSSDVERSRLAMGRVIQGGARWV